MLELQHISYETEENREILHDISLTIQDRFVAITGPNGGGKSTLAKIIAGIYTPTSGRILLDGEDITALSITERARRGISYAPTSARLVFAPGIISTVSWTPASPAVN